MDIIFDNWRSRSPHYGETHEAITHSVRQFIQQEAAPNVDLWEEQKSVPREFNRKAGEAGILGLGFPEEYGGTSEMCIRDRLIPLVCHLTPLATTGYRLSNLIIPFCHFSKSCGWTARTYS